MEENVRDVKTILSEKLVKLRKQKKMTQSELALRLNYTDKSISKWEHGESVPPIDILKNLADFYNVTLDYLVTDCEDISFDKMYNAKENTTNKIIITLLALSIVWFVATIIFLYGSFRDITKMWLTFIYALPISSIILIVFNSIWGKRKFIFWIVSILIWTMLAAFYLTFLKENIWSIFFLGIPMQISTILWSKLKPTNPKNTH